MIEKIKKFLSDKEKIKHYVTYIIFGVLATVVNFVSFWLFRRLLPNVDENIANIISIAIAMTFAFFTNRTFVFKSKGDSILKEFVKFISGRIVVSLLFEVVLFWLLTLIFPDKEIFLYIAKGVCCFFVMVANYIVSRFFVFKKDKQANKTTEEAKDEKTQE